MLTPSTPAAPRLARTFAQAACSVAGACTLSIRLYHRPPLTPFSSADTMRSVHTVASAHDQLRASAPRVACPALPVLSLLGADIAPPPSCLPSLGPALLTGRLAAVGRCGTMKALTPAPLTLRRRSLRLLRLAFRASRPQTRCVPRTSLCQSPQRVRPVASRRPGFAVNPRARRHAPPKQVRHPTGCSFASGCSPPRLATTQLPSATCAVTSHDKDSHLADKASSRTHGFPLARE